MLNVMKVRKDKVTLYMRFVYQQRTKVFAWIFFVADKKTQININMKLISERDGAFINLLLMATCIKCACVSVVCVCTFKDKRLH